MSPSFWMVAIPVKNGTINDKIMLDYQRVDRLVIRILLTGGRIQWEYEGPLNACKNLYFPLW